MKKEEERAFEEGKAPFEAANSLSAAKNTTTTTTTYSSSSSNPPILPHSYTIDREATLKRLAQIAVAYAEAGADAIAPSDMQDCTVQQCKRALFAAGLGERTALMSFSAKFCSCLYGPFRAVQSASLGPDGEPLGKGNTRPIECPRNAYGERMPAATQCSIIATSRATAQLPVGAMGLAMRALQRDIEQGADILMIKPACFYGDVVREAKACFPAYPIAAFQTGGEYAMIHWAGEHGAFEREQAVRESIRSLLRAETSIVVSYWVPQLLLGQWGTEGWFQWGSE